MAHAIFNVSPVKFLSSFQDNVHTMTNALKNRFNSSDKTDANPYNNETDNNPLSYPICTLQLTLPEQQSNPIDIPRSIPLNIPNNANSINSHHSPIYDTNHQENLMNLASSFNHDDLTVCFDGLAVHSPHTNSFYNHLNSPPHPIFIGSPQSASFMNANQQQQQLGQSPQSPSFLNVTTSHFGSPQSPSFLNTTHFGNTTSPPSISFINTNQQQLGQSPQSPTFLNVTNSHFGSPQSPSFLNTTHFVDATSPQSTSFINSNQQQLGQSPQSPSFLNVTTSHFGSPQSPSFLNTNHFVDATSPPSTSFINTNQQQLGQSPQSPSFLNTTHFVDTTTSPQSTSFLSINSPQSQSFLHNDSPSFLDTSTSNTLIGNNNNNNKSFAGNTSPSYNTGSPGSPYFLGSPMLFPNDDRFVPFPSVSQHVSPIHSPSGSYVGNTGLLFPPTSHVNSTTTAADIGYTPATVQEDDKVLPVTKQRKSTVKKTTPSGRRAKIHKCPYCQHTSNRANNMKEHVQIHDPNRPKPHMCKLCHRPFARKHDMTRHYLSCKKHKLKKTLL